MKLPDDEVCSSVELGAGDPDQRLDAAGVYLADHGHIAISNAAGQIV